MSIDYADMLYQALKPPSAESLRRMSERVDREMEMEEKSMTLAEQIEAHRQGGSD